MPSTDCQPASNTADSMPVIAAVYGYNSVVTSSLRARASSIICSRRGVARSPLLVICTACSGAPVSADAEIASSSACTLCLPPLRKCTKQVAPYFAAARNISTISAREAAGVYCIPNPTPAAPRGVARRQEIARVVHHPHAHRDVPRRCPVVNQALILSLVVPGVHIGHPH